MAKKWMIGSIFIVLAIYIGAIVFGMRTKDLSLFQAISHHHRKMEWQAPYLSTLPYDPQSDRIRRGAQIFNETPEYAAPHTGANISCGNCHVAGGIRPYASPMVGLPALFPMYNRRAGHVISLKDRIQECFVRSENGTPLAYDGEEMQDLVAYIAWLSMPQLNTQPFVGRGLVRLPDLRPDPQHGAIVYAAQCAGCHGEHGQGLPPQFPPVWGSHSFNDGAGMNSISKMAAFVQHNMPQNRTGTLSPQDAYDVASYIHEQPRPQFNPKYKSY